jgi:CysZ protein
MPLLKELIISCQSYYQAHLFIRRHKLWKWIVIPGFFYALLFSFGLWFFIRTSNEAITYLLGLSGIPHWLQQKQSGWLNFFLIFDEVILRLVLLFFYFSLFKYLILIIGSPVFAYLSERTEAIMEGIEYRYDAVALRKNMIRSIGLAFRNALWQTVYTITLLLLSFIPLAGWVAPLVAFLIECYYYGLSMLDHSCARHQLSRTQSIEFIGERKGLAIGNGIVFYTFHLFLIAGWVLAPAYALISATLSVYPLKQQSL